MRSVTLGKTGRVVTRVGLGGEGVLRTRGRVAEAMAVIEAALAAGITYYDSARAYDDSDSGTFTAYLEVADPKGESVDCTEVACAIYTRNDHTALGDRVQDLYLPVAFAG